MELSRYPEREEKKLTVYNQVVHTNKKRKQLRGGGFLHFSPMTTNTTTV